MITHFDKLALDLPHPNNPSPNSAAAVQELLGGKFGEMSAFMNYTIQSFGFRGRSRMRPFYDLIANLKLDLLHNFFLACGTRREDSRLRNGR